MSLQEVESMPSLPEARGALVRHPLALTVPGAVASYAEGMAAGSLGCESEHGRELWDVQKIPLVRVDGTPFVGVYGIIRTDNKNELGVVGKRYATLQSSQIAEALERTFGHMGALKPKLANAGAIGVGDRIFAQLALPAELSALLRVRKDTDSETGAYLTLTSTHDGTAACHIGATVTRIVCRNTFALANRQMKGVGLKLVHAPKNMADYQERVSTFLKSAALGFKETGERLNAYSERVVMRGAATKAVKEILFGEVMPDEDMTAQQRTRVDGVIEMIETRDGTFVPRGEVTAYSVLQAVTAFEMHRRPARGMLANDNRLWRVLTGDEVISNAFTVLDRVVLQ